MWISQGVMSLLIIIATTEGYKDPYPAPRAIIPSEALPIPRLFPHSVSPVYRNCRDCSRRGFQLVGYVRNSSGAVRESRSSIFWTGSRYNRRGSDGLKKQVKQRADRFYMGSRYGKRAGIQTRISAWDIDWDQREPCGEVDLGYCADRHIILVCEGQNSVDKKAGPEKKLTPLGQEQMTRVANRLAELNLSYCYIMSSTSIAGQESLAIISKEIDAKKSGVNESLKDGHPVVPEPSRLLTPIPDHEFHQNVMKMEYAYRWLW
ncbi:unnamed protein product [Nesidiocoris tenuis]|uniref:Uncharacterized protein n=1 Tax=Nesidiocoris tenuis TaxID=355587 RepID=A0A6H5GFQ9_9HEMI|nr:unnamed protein product [Nesidiocoris tenuis]